MNKPQPPSTQQPLNKPAPVDTESAAGEEDPGSAAEELRRTPGRRGDGPAEAPEHRPGRDRSAQGPAG